MNNNSTPKKIKKVRLEELSEETRQTAPSKSRMSIRELSEAYKDKNHPRHDEAAKEYERTAKSLAPRIAEYQKFLGESSALLSSHKVWLPDYSPVLKQYQSIQKAATRNLLPSFKFNTSVPVLPEPVKALQQTPSIPSISSPTLKNVKAISEHLAQDAQERAEREKQQLELFQKQCEILESVAAGQSVLAQEIATLREQQAQSDAKNSRTANWNLSLVALTLLATVIFSLITITSSSDKTDYQVPEPTQVSYSPSPTSPLEGL